MFTHVAARADRRPSKGLIFGVLQVIRRLLTRPEYFRLERELAGLGFHQGEQCALQGTHTNPVENAIRPICLTRKNALFAGHEIGAENWALLASIVATCKLNDVNPAAYIAETLEAIIDGHPHSRIEDLMPWRFRKASSPHQ